MTDKSNGIKPPLGTVNFERHMHPRLLVNLPVEC